MHILVLGINYSPEKTSVAPFTTGLCEHLVSQGHEVNVITAFPHYPEWRIWDGYRGHLYKQERLNDVLVRRVRHFVPSRASNLFQRLAHDFSFALSALIAGLFAGKLDLIYCSSPPPAIALSAYVLSKIYRKPYIMKLTDLASDAALATGILKDGLAARAARSIEEFVYHRAHAVVCLCEGFVGTLASRGIPSEKLQIIPDWADSKKVFPIADATTFRRDNGLTADQFLVMHTGNMGKKQGLINVVRAAELSQDSTDLVWMLVGQGEERATIEQEVRRRGLNNVKMLPLQPADRLAEMYSAADVLLLNQIAATGGAVIPSKLLTYMAAGRSIVAAASDGSEAAKLIRSARCGLIVPPEEPKSLVDAALSLRRDSHLRGELGENGRIFVSRNFTKQRVLDDYERLFRQVVGDRDTGERGNEFESSEATTIG